jgi:predicted AAA+ superfamily ATPase
MCVRSVNQIEVIQGIRRSGKSTIFKLLINYLSKTINPKKILYINLDDPFFIPYSNDATKFYDIVEIAEKLSGEKIEYLFLDEVQAINGWERYIKSVYDSQTFKKIFITGSNAKFLSKDLAILLSGRYFATKIYPLSLNEILKINNINSYMDIVENRAKLLKITDDIMMYGSFVEVYNAKEEFKRDIIKSYYETIILKDCIANNSIRDAKSFKELSFYLLSNIAHTYSYNSVSKAIKITDVSAKEYIGYLEDSFLLYEIKHFSYSLKEQNNHKKKIYIIDNGFMLLNYSFTKNLGALFENLVFSELIKREYDVYFYNKNFECDFIAKKNDKLIAIQVCYELNDKNTKREINALKKLPFNVDKKYIITYNQKQKFDDIEVIRFFEW